MNTVEQVVQLLKTLQEQLTQFQEKEEAHHREINGTLALLIEDKREQGQRLTLLENRVGKLEEKLQKVG